MSKFFHHSFFPHSLEYFPIFSHFLISLFRSLVKRLSTTKHQRKFWLHFIYIRIWFTCPSYKGKNKQNILWDVRRQHISNLFRCFWCFIWIHFVVLKLEVISLRFFQKEEFFRWWWWWWWRALFHYLHNENNTWIYTNNWVVMHIILPGIFAFYAGYPRQYISSTTFTRVLGSMINFWHTLECCQAKCHICIIIKYLQGSFNFIILSS